MKLHIDPIKHVDTVALGVWFGVGTRDEPKIEHNGIAHLTEHMLFKGTKSRKALDIVKQIEDVGAHINAYTSREITAYTVYALKENVDLALEILADMVQNSLFNEEELTLERGVIAQEIGMYADTPDEIIHDDVFETAYANQSFGRPILGRVDVINSIQQADLFDYTRNHYHHDNAVLSVSGNVDEASIKTKVDDLFKDWHNNEKRTRTPALYHGGHSIIARKDLEQTHIIYGLNGVARNDDLMMAQGIYRDALGGGMASRLFQEVREKRGLAYSVYASNQLYDDAGFFNVYAGTNPDKAQECYDVIKSEISNALDHITETDIERAKTGRRASLLMSQERMSSRADRHANQIIHYGRVVPIKETLEKLEAVTRDDIAKIVAFINASKPTVALRGPKVNKIKL